MLTKRFGRVQPFADVNSREDNRYNGVQLGFITYSQPEDGGEEEYQQTYWELGARCDHLADPLCDLFNIEHEPQTASNASAQDARRLRKAPVDKKATTEEAVAS